MIVFNNYDVYTETGSLYCYKGSLRNKMDIHDYNTLKSVETDIYTIKQNYLMTNPIRGRFTVNHLRMIHKFLFEDIYRFAGHFRKETIKKGDITFLSANDIPSKLYKLLDELKHENNLSGLSFDFFIERLAYYFAELNYIHPFREGNGRATREYIRQLAHRSGYDVDWNAVSVDSLLNAMVESVYNTAALMKILRICLIKEKE